MDKARLVDLIFSRETFLCVGLDTDPNKLPDAVRGNDDAVFTFNRGIIDATRAHCIAYKLNVAFYEAMGPKGWDVLRRTIAYIGKDHLVIADAKRGDIGNTTNEYAKAFFSELDADALTVSPYMGSDSVKPYLGYKGKWTILLAATSNPGSADFQRLKLESGEFLYEQVVRTATGWGGDDSLMFVVGATRVDELARIRTLAPNYFFLVPGVGAQGGDLEEVCKAAMTSDCGILVNASRSIIYASSGPDWSEAAEKEAGRLHLQMGNMLVRYTG